MEMSYGHLSSQVSVILEVLVVKFQDTSAFIIFSVEKKFMNNCLLVSFLRAFL